MDASRPTKRQEQFLRYIAEHPNCTMRAIGKALRVASPNGVLGQIAALRRKGFVTWEPNCHGSLRLTKAGEMYFAIPLEGVVR